MRDVVCGLLVHASVLCRRNPWKNKFKFANVLKRAGQLARTCNDYSYVQYDVTITLTWSLTSSLVFQSRTSSEQQFKIFWSEIRTVFSRTATCLRRRKRSSLLFASLIDSHENLELQLIDVASAKRTSTYQCLRFRGLFAVVYLSTGQLAVSPPSPGCPVGETLVRKHPICEDATNFTFIAKTLFRCSAATTHWTIAWCTIARADHSFCRTCPAILSILPAQFSFSFKLLLIKVEKGNVFFQLSPNHRSLFCILAQNRRQKVFNRGLCVSAGGSWHSKNWQNLHWFIGFHVSIWRTLESFLGG